MPTPPLPLSRPMLAGLLSLLAACQTPSEPSPPSVTPERRLPALPPAARQPEPPALCSPSCSAGLMTLRESLQRMLTEPEPQGSPARPGRMP